MFNDDFKDMLRGLLENKAKFLVVGAYALGVHGHPRATGDIDIWVEADLANSARVFRSLAAFGAPMDDISKTTFAEPGLIFQIGVAPRRIDIITSIDGVVFEDAWPNRVLLDLDGVLVPFLGRTDLIKNKSSTGRPKDLLDVNVLTADGDADK